SIHLSSSAAALGQSGSVPDEGGRACKRKGSHVARDEVPGKRPITGRTRIRIADLFRAADHDRLRAAPRLFEPLALHRRQDVVRVLEDTGRRHKMTMWHCELHVERAKIRVELADAQVAERIPAVYIVVDRRAWEPLGNFEGLAV